MPPEAILATLRHMWRVLEPLNVPVALMGGLALATWKYVRATKDVDLLLHVDQGDPTRLMETLQASGVRMKRSPQPTRLGELELIQAVYEPPETFLEIQVDLMLANSEYHRRALDRRLPLRLPGLDIEIAVLTCEDLILHKLLAERLLDQADSVALLQANRGSLDYAYLADWADKNHVGPALAQAWQRAWPGQPMPS